MSGNQKKLTKRKYYEFPAMDDIEDMSEEEVMEGIRNLLTEGVHNELISDVPV